MKKPATLSKPTAIPAEESKKPTLRPSSSISKPHILDTAKKIDDKNKVL